MDELFNLGALQDIVLEGGGDVYKRHARFNAILEVDVPVEVLGGPEVDKLDAVAGAPDTVDPAEALDNADRIPVNVVVDQVVAVLKVLAFADAVGSYEQVNLAHLQHRGNLGTLFGAR